MVLAYMENPQRKNAWQDEFSTGKYLFVIVRNEPHHCSYKTLTEHLHKFVKLKDIKMKHYLYNLLSRLQQFSQDLDKKEIFIDIPWVIIDEQQNQQKYIFRRDGKLVMSLNGQAAIGKWEYLSTAKSLLIDRNTDKILLNQNFIDPAVMVLKKDCTKDENLILANEILLPGLDVFKYLKNLYYQKNNIGVRPLKSGENLEFYNYEGVINGNKVTIDGEPVPNQILELANSNRKLIIEDSRIVRVLAKRCYDTNLGKIIIEKKENTFPSSGNIVYIDENVYAPDGKYRLAFMRHIRVENGKIL